MQPFQWPAWWNHGQAIYADQINRTKPNKPQPATRGGDIVSDAARDELIRAYRRLENEWAAFSRQYGDAMSMANEAEAQRNRRAERMLQIQRAINAIDENAGRHESVSA